MAGPGGFGAVTDQVVRLRKMLEEHPDVEVTHFRHPRWHFRATRYDSGLRREICNADLGLLLDQLGERLAGD